MTLNFVGGFRRIGWVLTVPLAAFFVLLFFDQTKEVSGYESKQAESGREAQPWEKTVELPNIRSKAYFPIDTSEEVIRRITGALEEEHQKLKPWEENWSSQTIFEISVQKNKVNKLKLIGLILASGRCFSRKVLLSFDHSL